MRITFAFLSLNHQSSQQSWKEKGIAGKAAQF